MTLSIDTLTACDVGMLRSGGGSAAVDMRGDISLSSSDREEGSSSRITTGSSSITTGVSGRSGLEPKEGNTCTSFKK